MNVLSILSPMSNFTIASSFVVGFTTSILPLVSWVSIKGWKGNFSFKSQKLVFKEKKKHKRRFFSIFTPDFTVSCMKTNHTRYKEIVPTISLFLEFKELSQMLFSWKFCFEIFCSLKKSVHILSLEVSLEV